MIGISVFTQVSYEMDLITQKENAHQQFQNEWEKYVLMVISYGLSHNTPARTLRHALRDYQEFSIQGISEGLFLTIWEYFGVYYFQY